MQHPLAMPARYLPQRTLAKHVRDGPGPASPGHLKTCPKAMPLQQTCGEDIHRRTPHRALHRRNRKSAFGMAYIGPKVEFGCIPATREPVRVGRLPTLNGGKRCAAWTAADDPIPDPSGVVLTPAVRRRPQSLARFRRNGPPRRPSEGHAGREDRCGDRRQRPGCDPRVGAPFPLPPRPLGGYRRPRFKRCCAQSCGTASRPSRSRHGAGTPFTRASFIRRITADCAMSLNRRSRFALGEISEAPISGANRGRSEGFTSVPVVSV
jgi:hypothetical protein